MREQCVDEARHPLGHDEREQRVRCPEGVPQAQRGVVDPARRLQHLATRAPHPAIGIGDIARVLQRPVQRRVEEPPRAGVGLDAQPAEQLVPGPVRRRANRIEALRGRRVQIALCAVLVDRGKPDAGFEHAVGAHVELEQQPGRLLACRRRQCLPGTHRAAELHDEGHLPLHPVPALQRALQPVLSLRDIGRKDRRLLHVVQPMLQVHEHLHPARAVEAVALQRDLRCRGQLDGDAMRCQAHGIPAGPGALLRLGGTEIPRAGAPGRARARLQQHIAQFGDAGAAVPGVGETQDAPITMLVAGAVAPAPVGVVGPREDHAEGRRRPWRHMAGAGRADEGVDMVRPAHPRHA